MRFETLNCKRYNVGDGIYIIVSRNDSGRPIEILTSFSSDSNIPLKEMAVIDNLNDVWSSMLRDGISFSELEVYPLEQNEYTENALSILNKEMGG